MKTNDFSGIIGGRGYALFEEAYPHFSDLQQNIANIVEKHVLRNERKESCHVLEVGCGPGPTTNKLLQANPDICITAVDNEKQMIDEAKVNLSRYEGRVEFVLEDMVKYLATVPDNTFDAFASGWTLHNLEKTTRSLVLTEIYRVLKPGAVFVNGDKYVQSDLKKHADAYKWSIDSLTEIGRKYDDKAWADEWIKHMEYDEQEQIRMPEVESISEMKKIGFRNLEIPYREQMEAIMVAYK